MDIAKLGCTAERASVEEVAKSFGYAAAANSFGGLALESDSLGMIDLWWVEHKSPLRRRKESVWEAYLKMIDFGPNAVLFLWPEGCIVEDKRWIADLAARRITRTRTQLPRREIQAVRAIALAEKLRLSVGAEFKLDGLIRKDLRWLVEKAHDEALHVALAYLRAKLRSGRWPRETLARFATEVRRYKAGGRIVGLLDM